MKKFHTRRDFLKTGGKAAAAFTLVPRFVLGGKGYIPPSDRLNIALVGAGGKAGDHIRALKATETFVAFCDVDDRRAVDAYEEFPKVPRFRDFREMLDTAGRDIDAVMVTTPDHTHAVAAVAAMQLGKHVYVEKPLTHNIREARQLLEAARKYKVVTQMGNQGASMDCNAELAEWVQSGVIGKVKRAHVWTNRPVWPQGVPVPPQEPVPAGLDWDLWLGPAPMRGYSERYLPFRWRGWWDFGTGALGDMGCHLIDPVYRALKLSYPTSIEASATTVWSDEFQEADYPDSCPPSSVVRMDFPARGKMPACELWWYDGGVRPMRPAELGSNEPFGSWDGGALIEGSKGKILCGIYGQDATLLPTSKMKDFKPPRPTEPRYQGSHQAVWARACKGEGKTSSPFEYAVPLTEAILIGNLAVRCYDIKKLQKGKTKDSWAPYDYPGRIRLEWDAANMRITNFEGANAFVGREYRKGWSLGM
ncbi:MAG: Gfo/Idh/MocA family oxidoreductase [Saprospiraceae bacterium]|nr:Gfo/Idh/MocA family oxidoreductase [Saprospiraceae bacterium]MCB0573564.1 Gfo/Idh/MocA family oxidoreductase [Saprospiraceae bacterium]MCB9354159.1 Gfo/Idh/MocA family oxidoreductase [Lewinellaceae bacterium]